MLTPNVGMGVGVTHYSEAWKGSALKGLLGEDISQSHELTKGEAQKREPTQRMFSSLWTNNRSRKINQVFWTLVQYYLNLPTISVCLWIDCIMKEEDTRQQAQRAGILARWGCWHFGGICRERNNRILTEERSTEPFDLFSFIFQLTFIFLFFVVYHYLLSIVYQITFKFLFFSFFKSTGFFDSIIHTNM